MIIAIGVDACSLDRIRALHDKYGERLLRRLLSPAEREAAGRLADPVARIAGRFAAKEAVMKALGTGWSQGVNFADIEVVNSPSGAPELRLYGGARARSESLGIRRWHISITHERSHAIALVIAEE